MSLSLGIVFGLICMVSYGLANTIAKLSLKTLDSKRTIFFRELLISGLLLITLLFFIKETTFSLSFILITVGIAVLGYIPLFTFYKALKIGKIGVVAPVANSSVIFTVILSILFFRESLKIWQIYAIILIVAGIILISLDFKDLRKSQLFSFSSGIPLALITCFLWGFVYFFLKIPTSTIGPFLTSFILEFIIMITAGLHIFLAKSSFSIPDKKTILHLFFLAFFGAIGLLAFNIGIKFSPVSIVAALMFANPLIATLAGKIIFQERLTFQQYISIFTIVAGVVLIAL